MRKEKFPRSSHMLTRLPQGQSSRGRIHTWPGSVQKNLEFCRKGSNDFPLPRLHFFISLTIQFDETVLWSTVGMNTRYGGSPAVTPPNSTFPQPEQLFIGSWCSPSECPHEWKTNTKLYSAVFPFLSTKTASCTIFYFSTSPGLCVTTERKYNTGADSFFSQLVIRVCPPWWARPLQWVHPVLSLLPLVLQTSLHGIKSCKYNVAHVKNLSLIDSQKSNCWAKRVYCLNFNWYLQSPSVRFYQLALPPAMPEAACLLTASPTDGVCAGVKTLTARKKTRTSTYFLACIFLIAKHNDGKPCVLFLTHCPNSALFYGSWPFFFQKYKFIWRL